MIKSYNLNSKHNHRMLIAGMIVKGFKDRISSTFWANGEFSENFVDFHYKHVSPKAKLFLKVSSFKETRLWLQQMVNLLGEAVISNAL